MSKIELLYANALVNGNSLLRFTYTNHRGITEEREVRPISIEFGKINENKPPCWMLRSFCRDRNCYRNFVMSKMRNIRVVQQ